MSPPASPTVGLQSHGAEATNCAPPGQMTSRTAPLRHVPLCAVHLLWQCFIVLWLPVWRPFGQPRAPLWLGQVAGQSQRVRILLFLRLASAEACAATAVPPGSAPTGASEATGTPLSTDLSQRSGCGCVLGAWRIGYSPSLIHVPFVTDPSTRKSVTPTHHGGERHNLFQNLLLCVSGTSHVWKQRFLLRRFFGIW